MDIKGKSNIPWSGLIALFIAISVLGACGDNPVGWEDLSEISVDLNVIGTPVEDNFVVEWSDPDNSNHGARRAIHAVGNAEIFGNVPVGSIMVELLTVPINCTAEVREQTVTVRRDERTAVIFDATCE
jgi:hypothetical protein